MAVGGGGEASVVVGGVGVGAVLEASGGAIGDVAGSKTLPLIISTPYLTHAKPRISPPYFCSSQPEGAVLGSQSSTTFWKVSLQSWDWIVTSPKQSSSQFIFSARPSTLSSLPLHEEVSL